MPSDAYRKMGDIQSFLSLLGTCVIILGILAQVFDITRFLPRDRQDLTVSAPKSKIEDLGFEVLADGVDPIVDIVAIHGLDGHREKSWTADNGVMWLRDLLATDIPNARILTYGYDADTRSFEVTSTQTIFRHAQNFMKALARKRTGAAQQRPIIFLAHSLGGIVLKKALIIGHSQNSNADSQLHDILASTHTVIFFGTPHAGVKGIDLLQMVNRVISIYMKTNDIVLRHLKEHSSELEETQSMYLDASKDIHNVYFYEVYSTPTIAGRRNMIVPYHSATIAGERDATIEGLSADHVQIVKYHGKTDAKYDTVLYYLREALENVKPAVDRKRLIERRY